MNDNDKKVSSNQSQMNTTPFKNRYENFVRNRLNNVKNNNFHNQFNPDNIEDLNNGAKQRLEKYTDDAPKNQVSTKNQNSNSKNINSELNSNDNELNRERKQKKFGVGSTANNLRNKLNTVPTNLDKAKQDAVKKGIDTLKKSSHPLAKMAGYTAGAYQKHKEKKQKKEQEEKNKEDNQENNDNLERDEENTTVNTGNTLLKKFLPLILAIVPFIAVFVILAGVLSPVISAYSWFISLFNNKNAESGYTIYSEKDETKRKLEQDYNNAILGSSDGSIKGIVAEYQEKYGVTIDWYLLNAIITYRYTLVDGEKLYTSDGNDAISDEDLQHLLDNLESENQTDENSSNSNEINSSVDFTDAKKKIQTVASLMIINENGSYSTDNNVGGKVYNNLIESNFLKTYYKDFLKNDSYDSRKKLVDEIYEYAEGARQLLENGDDSKNGGVVSDTSIVHLQTCKQNYTFKQLNGMTVYNNPSASEGTNYPDYLNMRDYIKGVLYREIGINNSYKEAMKAQAIAALSYLINDSRSGFNLKSGEMYFPSGTCRQATCSPTYGCTSVVEPTSPNLHTFYIGTNRFSNGKSYDPISSSEDVILEEVLNDVFGKIMVKKGITSASFSGSSDAIQANYLDSCNPGNCFSQKGAISDAKGGMNYTDILKKYYSSVNGGNGFGIINITEGLYFQSGGNYNGPANLNENYHYHQGDSEWRNLTLCDSGSISGNGCNITSAAMAISILKNERITPKVLQSRQGSISQCTQETRPQMIMNFAKLYGLSAIGIKKSNTSDVNDMLQKMSTGNYVVIVRLAPSTSKNVRYYTSGGHYMAGVAVKTENGKNKLLIWDPGSERAERDNYWADLETDLMPYLVSEYSFILIGK